EPGRNVEMPLLGRFENIIVMLALFPDLRRHAVEPLRRFLRARQRHIGDGACYTTVAIVEGMNGDEPKVSDASAQDKIGSVILIEPAQEGAHFRFKKCGLGRLEMHALMTDRTGNDLHRTFLILAPFTDDDLVHSAPSRREQRRMPAEESVFGQT